MKKRLSKKTADKLVYLGLLVAALIPITALIKSFIIAKAEGLRLGSVKLDYLYSLGNNYAAAAYAHIFAIVLFFNKEKKSGQT